MTTKAERMLEIAHAVFNITDSAQVVEVLENLAHPGDTVRMPEGWLTVSEAAKRRGMKPQQIRDAIDRGDLRADKHGFVWLIKVEDIDALEIRPRGRPRLHRRGRPPK